MEPTLPSSATVAITPKFALSYLSAVIVADGRYAWRFYATETRGERSARWKVCTEGNLQELQRLLERKRLESSLDVLGKWSLVKQDGVLMPSWWSPDCQTAWRIEGVDDTAYETREAALNDMFTNGVASSIYWVTASLDTGEEIHD